jgi:hypothetical protein
MYVGSVYKSCSCHSDMEVVNVKDV